MQSSAPSQRIMVSSLFQCICLVSDNFIRVPSRWTVLIGLLSFAKSCAVWDILVKLVPLLQVVEGKGSRSTHRNTSVKMIFETVVSVGQLCCLYDTRECCRCTSVIHLAVDCFIRFCLGITWNQRNRTMAVPIGHPINSFRFRFFLPRKDEKSCHAWTLLRLVHGKTWGLQRRELY